MRGSSFPAVRCAPSAFRRGPALWSSTAGHTLQRPFVHLPLFGSTHLAHRTLGVGQVDFARGTAHPSHLAGSGAVQRRHGSEAELDTLLKTAGATCNHPFRPFPTSPRGGGRGVEGHPMRNVARALRAFGCIRWRVRRQDNADHGARGSEAMLDANVSQRSQGAYVGHIFAQVMTGVRVMKESRHRAAGAAHRRSIGDGSPRSVNVSQSRRRPYDIAMVLGFDKGAHVQRKPTPAPPAKHGGPILRPLFAMWARGMHARHEAEHLARIAAKTWTTRAQPMSHASDGRVTWEKAAKSAGGTRCQMMSDPDR